MKVLFAGLGSAGQRHLRNLKHLYGEKAEIMAFRVRKLQHVFDNEMNICEGINLDEEYGIQVFEDYSTALKSKPDIVFITNRNSEHLYYAMEAAKAGCHLFIEKPISDTLKGIDQLDSEVKKHGKIAYVGYQNRLHPCIKMAKNILERGILGNIYMVYSEIGEYLPNMHPWEDYRMMHEANRNLGGGVTICQLHELDYLYFLFGMPKEIYCIGGKRSGMEIDVEDTVTALCKVMYQNREIAINIHMDFIQSPPTRHCKIAGDMGRFEFDLVNNTYGLYLSDGTIEKNEFETFVRNDMFLEEMERFIDAVMSGREEGILGIEEGKKSIQFALKIKESMYTGNIVFP